jgi:predicted transposase YdaD
MEKLYDPTLKALVETAPADWLPLLHLPRARVSVIDADIAAVLSGAADKVLRVRANPEYLLHLDFQAGHDSARLPRRLRLYNTVLEDRHDLPVRSVAVLLHPGADSPQLTGTFERAFPGEEPYSFFRYEVVRVWQVPVKQLLGGGLGTLALAPIGNVPQSELPGVIRQMERRLRRPRGRVRAAEIWAAAYVLLGLRYSSELAAILLRGVLTMKESSTYQAIVAEGLAQGLAQGAAQEARKALMLVGKKLLGEPDEAAATAINAIGDVHQLEQLIQRACDVSSWEELLAQPTPRRRHGRRKPTR